MKERLITIRMPKESLRLWLEGLRSGKYEQGRSRLKSTDGSMCCLGVMEHCIAGKVEIDKHGEHPGLPSDKWLEAHNVQFANYEGRFDRAAPFLPLLGKSAYAANDCGDYDFNQIADAIEACAEGF